MSRALLEAEIARLQAKAARYGPDTLWQQNEFCEILPQPTPFSLSLLRSLASADGATGRVCRELGIAYRADVPMEDYLETIVGRTFVNRAAEKRLNGGGSEPGRLRRLFSSVKIEAARKTMFRRFPETVAELDAAYTAIFESRFDALSDADLLGQMRTLIEQLNGHYRYVVKAGLLAKLSLDELAASSEEQQLTELLRADSRKVLGTDQTGQHILEFKKKRLAALVGFSAEVEYELAIPRFAEDGRLPQIPAAGSKGAVIPTGLSTRCRHTLFYFKIYENLKVIYKTLLLRELALLRSALLVGDRRFGLNGGIFYLHFDELLSGKLTNRHEVIAQRRQKEQVFLTVDVPTSLRPEELASLLTDAAPPPPQQLKGLLVNGAAFEGRAIRYRNRSDLQRITAGDIVIARHASPDLVQCFDCAGGIITETGGQLSHLAIVAREQGFPLLLQTARATTAIAEGEWLRVAGDGTVIRA